MKKLIAIGLLVALSLTLASCNGGSENPSQSTTPGATSNSSDSQSKPSTGNNSLKDGYSVRIFGDWKIQCPELSTNRKDKNTYAIDSTDGNLKILFGGYMEGGRDMPDLCDNLESIVDACEDSLKDRLSLFYSTKLTKDNMVITADKQEKVTIGSFDMLKVSGTISDSHQNSSFVFEAYYSLVDISGTTAPLYLFGYCEQGSISELKALTSDMISTLSKS